MKTNIELRGVVFVLAWLACSACASEKADDKNEQSVEPAASESAAVEQNPEQLAAVMAIEGDAEYGAYLGGECLTCHAPDGGDGSIPQIHGKDKSYLAGALLAYKNKQRESEVMRGVTAALTDEEIAALVSYFSAQ